MLRTVLVGVAAVFGGSLLILVAAYAEMVVHERRRAVVMAEKGPMTIVWKDTDVMLMAATGTIRPLGEFHICLTDKQGWPTVIDRRDIVEVIA